MFTRCECSVIHKTIRLKCKRAFDFLYGYSRYLVFVTQSILVAGCSVTSPIASLIPDDQIATGSIHQTHPSSFVDKLSPEDWRRAKAALGVALEPQSTGTPVKWENPETKTTGSFAATGAFVVHNDLVCRPFQATLAVNGVLKNPTGFGCRVGPGDWVVEEPTPITNSKKLQPGSLF